MQNIKLIISVSLLWAGIASADTWYVATNSVSDGPGTSWSNAFHTIQGGVNAASNNDTVLVTNGVYDTDGAVTPGYACSNRVVITNNIVVRSVNGPKKTFIVGAGATGGGNGTDAVRGVYISAGILVGFTISNCHTMTSGDLNYDQSGGGINMYGGDGSVSNCTLTGNSADFFGGGSYKGHLYNCTLTDNSSKYGGASSYSTLYNCTLAKNLAYEQGGGSYFGTLYNCIITDNFTYGYGGGSDGCILNNCTLTGNSARWGGGSHYGTLYNCIIWRNKDSSGTTANWYNGNIFYSCTTPLPSGTGNITNAPMLLSASHIHADSICVGAGTNTYALGTDIDGDTWGNPPSMGCDEPGGAYSGNLEVSIKADYTSTLPEYNMDFAAEISGEVASNRWAFGDGTSLENAVYISHTWATTGDYTVILTSWNDDNPGGVSATTTVHIVNNASYYVNASNSSPVVPYSSWETAATTIQDAIDEAATTLGATVWVTNGIYDSGETVTPGHSCNNRVVITNDIVVRSVNGPEKTFIAGAEATNGGNGTNAVRGVYMSSGVLIGFTVTNGHTMNWIGDIDYDRSGGGINMHGGDGAVSNCVFIGNSAGMNGGGSAGGEFYNCIFMSNSVYFAGGGNSAGKLYNCTLTGNTAQYGGGNNYSVLYNCTITDNSATNSGGGSYNCILTNSVVWNNTAPSNPNWKDSTFSYSCTTPLPSGTGNITNNPQFIDTAGGNYRLAYGSSCINTGTNQSWMNGAGDIDGIDRIINGTVDMGAYEYDRSTYDSDGDTMPDGWEIDNGFSPTNAGDAAENPDSDPFNNIEEYIADTDPNSSNDWFHIAAVSNASASSAQTTVYFKSSGNRLYTLLGCSNLLNAIWINVPGAGPITGIGGADSITDTNVPGKGPFYRMRVNLP